MRRQAARARTGSRFIMPINHRLSAIELEDDELTTEEKAILDQRLEDFRRTPESGVNRLPV